MDEIHSGGPPKDGIPSLTIPHLSKPRKRISCETLTALALTRHGVSKAYPLRILNWHEIVNDRFGDEGIVITYRPLCSSGTASEAKVAGNSCNLAYQDCSITVMC